MSLRPRPWPEVPVLTAQVAKAAFGPAGSLAIRLRAELGAWYEDADFAGAYPVRGRPGISPAQLAAVTVLQFAENLADRQAADAVGVVTALASVAQPAQGDTAPSAPGQPGTGEDTVTMTVRLVHQNPAVHFDQAPVSVNIVSARASHVLAVPVSALMALADGGYAVQVTQGTGAHASTRLVPVQIGLFDDTLVQVSGPGLTLGMRVGVPSS